MYERRSRRWGLNIQFIVTHHHKERTRPQWTNQHSSGHAPLYVFTTSTPKLPANSQGCGAPVSVHLHVSNTDALTKPGAGCALSLLSIPVPLSIDKSISLQPLQRYRGYDSNCGNLTKCLLFVPSPMWSAWALPAQHQWPSPVSTLATHFIISVFAQSTQCSNKIPSTKSIV